MQLLQNEIRGISDEMEAMDVDDERYVVMLPGPSGIVLLDVELSHVLTLSYYPADAFSLAFYMYRCYVFVFCF